MISPSHRPRVQPQGRLGERPVLFSLKLEQALRWAASRHQAQTRKGSGVPYVEHVVGVAMILDRLGFGEDVVIAGLLHDLVEDTDVTLDQISEQFGPLVGETVYFCSERKRDEQGKKRPWIDRKREHIESLERAPQSAWAVMLADKLHNLLSIQLDQEEGREVWSHFNAERDQVIWYYRTVIERFGEGDPRLEHLAHECRAILAAVEGY